jgi:hypothetical protein
MVAKFQWALTFSNGFFLIGFLHCCVENRKKLWKKISLATRPRGRSELIYLPQKY